MVNVYLRGGFSGNVVSSDLPRPPQGHPRRHPWVAAVTPGYGHNCSGVTFQWRRLHSNGTEHAQYGVDEQVGDGTWYGVS